MSFSIYLRQQLRYNARPFAFARLPGKLPYLIVFDELCSKQTLY